MRYKGQLIMLIDHSTIKKSVIKSQHCQRNFDLNKQMPKEDLDLLVHAATNCPSKQNIAFYDLHIITDVNLIEQIHALSTGVTANNIETGESIQTTNSQTRANVLFIYERKELDVITPKAFEKWSKHDDAEVWIFERDLNTAIGISSGYVNIISSMLGYATGCCQCFQTLKIKELLNLERKPVLIMGIGYNNEKVNRRIHATDSSLMFPTNTKEEIQVSYH
jgi:nitroreductase